MKRYRQVVFLQMSHRDTKGKIEQTAGGGWQVEIVCGGGSRRMTVRDNCGHHSNGARHYNWLAPLHYFILVLNGGRGGGHLVKITLYV